jgi:hypothetical protein
MTTDNFCFYLQNRLIQTCQTGVQWYSDTSPFMFPGSLLPGFSSLMYCNTSLMVTFIEMKCCECGPWCKLRFILSKHHWGEKKVVHHRHNVTRPFFFVTMSVGPSLIFANQAKAQPSGAPKHHRQRQRFMALTPGPNIKTFYGRNLQLFIIS